MVIRGSIDTRTSRGALLTELVIAMAILALVIFPLTYGFWHEAKLARRYYQRAVAMEIVDGEMEVLAAGQWRAFAYGTHAYEVQAASLTNLPPGQFILTVQPPRLRLGWHPTGTNAVGAVVREVRLDGGADPTFND